MYVAIHIREHRFTYICSLTQLAKKEPSNYYNKKPTIFVVAEKNSYIKKLCFYSIFSDPTSSLLRYNFYTGRDCQRSTT